MSGPLILYEITVDPRTPMFNPSLQRGPTGNFINFSLNADGFGVSIAGSLSMIPQLAQVSAIIQGILGVFGLSQAPAEPSPQPKTTTIPPGVTLATLFGASQGIAFLVQVLKGKIEQVKNYINSAVQSIQNLIKCFFKNPLIAAALLAKLIRQGWITMPEPLKLVLKKAQELINTTIGLNLLINNPLTQFLNKLKEWLQYKFPPAILLPFIPYIPGCSDGFYSGRPPSAFLNNPTLSGVTPQEITRPGGFTSKINLNVPTIPVDFGPGAPPSLALTDNQVSNLLGGYDPYNLFVSGTAPANLNMDLQRTNYPLTTGANSNTRQVQDKLIAASNSVVNNISVLNKDISRAGFIPRPSPLDDLLCAPGEKYV